MKSIPNTKYIKRVWNDGDVDFFSYYGISIYSNGRSRYLTDKYYRVSRFQRNGCRQIGGKGYCYVHDDRFVDEKITAIKLKMIFEKYEKH